MRASEVLRGLADLLAGIESGNSTVDQTEPPAQTQTIELTPVEVDNTDSAGSSKFVPPLQAKLEILKKSVGMDNVYGDDGQEQEDELSRMRHMAGLNPAQQEASDDEPLDN
jgi:hypothetical protein